MGMSADCEPRDGYLCGRVAGELTLAEAQAATRVVLDAAARAGRAHILLDCTEVRGDWTRAHRIAFGIFLAEEQNYAAHRFAEPSLIAILVSPQLMDPARPTEKAANGRGGRVRASDDPDELYDWLGVGVPAA